MGSLLRRYPNADNVLYAPEFTYCLFPNDGARAIYKLHQIASIQPDNDEYPGYRHAVEVAQNTMTRMVIDIAYAFNRESQGINIEILSPAVGHIVRTAERHMLTAENFHNRQWLEEFDQLRRMLGFFNRRWVLAGEFRN